MSEEIKASDIPASVQGAVQPRFGEVHIRNRGRLPHWEKDSGLYFLTFNLADSLPRNVVEKLVERNRILLAAERTQVKLLPTQKVMIAEYSPKRIEEYFDHGMGECLLRDTRIAAAMVDALRFWHGKRYRLIAWCIMPNHVHVICALLPGHQLGEIIKSWKVHSAREANRIFGRSGSIWRREYYDRLIRNGGELERATKYVLSNPERAGLVKWPWVWCAGAETGST